MHKRKNSVPDDRLIDHPGFLNACETLWAFTALWMLTAVGAYSGEWQAVTSYWGTLW